MSVVGIDLGTTNTVVACVRAGKVHVLADEQGTRLLPSVVSFHPNGEVLVGAAAKARRVIDPKNTVYSHKRLIGRSWGSPEIAQAKTRYAFELKEGPGQGPLIRARGQDYTLPEISAFVLKRTRQIAETALGAPIERAVITVPAHFNELQRASTKVAGRVSGLEVLRILNEPTAAALAYGLGRTGNERVAVYDFGGGTFDCTLLDLNGNVFEVLATAGDSFLGGDDVDNLIAERMAETYLKAHRYDPRTDPQMLERLKTCAEDIKIALSTAETHTVVLKEFGHGSGGSSVNYTFTLSRSDLDHMITPLVERTFKVTQDALTLARLSPTSFDKVILVGGSTRTPLVRKRVEAFFGQVPLDRVNPDEVVAIGAAIQAAALTEGARRKSIPAAPPVIGKPKTFPGVQNDASDDTQTSQLETGALGVAKGDAPPGAAGPQTKLGVPGARAPGGPAAGRKVTNPGVAPATQPMGARQPPKPAGPPANDDEPSIASFPDLAVPTPFEWFPSGQPSSGEGGARSGPAGSERSFGGNTLTTPGADPKTMTAVSRGKATPADDGPGFGAIDEPPSLYSTPSASVPSFPSMSTGGGGPRMPSPIGEPEPFKAEAKQEAVPGGQFGAVRDMSLISSSGISSPGATAGAKDAPSSPDVFGHVSDLSLVSSAGAATDPGVAAARAKMADDLEDETEANVFGKKPDAAKAAEAAPAAPMAGFGEIDDGADLPAVVQTADLPSVVKGKGSPVRRPGQPGMSPGGGASMLGKPPPLVAPQPFGPMERIDEPPVSRTAAMPARPPQAAPSKPAPQAPVSKPARTPAAQPSQPAPRTAPMQAAPPPAASSSPARPSPQTAAFGSTAAMPPGAGGPPPFPQFGSAPPPGPAFGSHAPPAMPAPPPTAATAQFGSPTGGFGSAPPPGPPGFGSAPPPPGGYAPAGGSQPPIFGAFQSAPPAAHDPSEPLMGPGGSFGVTPIGSGPPRNIGYAAPILVDVTPRGLVVETAGGYTDTIIPRNSKIPCERTRRFATGRDMQTTVRVRVAQGEHQFFPQNTFLGEVELSGLRPAPRGEVVVAVTFEVDADGTLRVRARDVQTGQEARATLQLVGVADESSVVMMINRFADQPVSGGPTQ